MAGWIPASSSEASRGTSATAARVTGWARDAISSSKGDEYDSAFFDKTAKFLKYLPDIAVINNIEFDHADIYADLDAVRLAFRRLVNLVPRSGLLLLGADCPNASAMKKVAHEPGRDVRPVGSRRLARDRHHGLWRRADVHRAGTAAEPFATVSLPLFGAHNVRNALASIAVAHAVGMPAGDDCRRAAAVQGRQAPPGDLRRGRRGDRVRRLRASSHGHRRNARGAAGRESSSPHLGGVRAAFGVVEPQASFSRISRARSGRPTR